MQVHSDGQSELPQWWISLLARVPPWAEVYTHSTPYGVTPMLCSTTSSKHPTSPNTQPQQNKASNPQETRTRAQHKHRSLPKPALQHAPRASGAAPANQSAKMIIKLNRRAMREHGWPIAARRREHEMLTA